MLDPISDMLTRIRNASAAGHPAVVMSSSKLKTAIAETLRKNGFIDGYSVKETPGNKKFLTIDLRYTSSGPAITQIKRVSKEGQRHYCRAKDIYKTKNGYGISVITTSRGVMTGEEARKKRLGGEIICEVW